MGTLVRYMHPLPYLEVPCVLRVSQLDIKYTLSFINK